MWPGNCLGSLPGDGLLVSVLKNDFPYMNGITKCLCFCVLLISFSIMTSRVVHVVVCVRISFLFKPRKSSTHMLLFSH